MRRSPRPVTVTINLGSSDEAPEGDSAPRQRRGPRATSSLVIAGRLILLLAAAAATVAAFVLSRARDQAASGSAARYVCPMHPEVTAQSPSACPICRMALEQVRPALAPAESEQKVVGSATQRPFALEIRAPAWLESKNRLAAVLYRHDLAGLSPGERGLFFRAGAPASGISVRLDTEPPLARDTSTSRVHFRVEGGAANLHEGEVGWVKLAAKARDYLVVPSSAILYSRDGPYVLVPGGRGATFDKRPVEIGKVFGGVAVVLSGLRDGEPIAAASAFFLDAERRLQAGRGEMPVAQ